MRDDWVDERCFVDLCSFSAAVGGSSTVMASMKFRGGDNGEMADPLLGLREDTREVLGAVLPLT